VDASWQVVDVELPGPPLDPTLARFIDAWNRSDAKAVVAFFSDENRTSMLETIERSSAELGWEEYPAIVETTLDDRVDEDVIAKLEFVGGELITRWHVRGDATWGMHGLKFPKL
jgi:hypothetical protein